MKKCSNEDNKIVQKYQSIISNFYKHDNINIYRKFKTMKQ